MFGWFFWGDFGNGNGQDGWKERIGNFKALALFNQQNRIQLAYDVGAWLASLELELGFLLYLQLHPGVVYFGNWLSVIVTARPSSGIDSMSSYCSLALDTHLQAEHRGLM